jgi:predicted regulator of Ras-like GTPase activity (Roadblock/LC7/MglB family)
MSIHLPAEVFSTIRDKVEGLRAVAIVRLDGDVEALETVDPDFDRGVLVEFAMLVRIALRTCEDAEGGGLSEMSWKLDRSIVLMSRVSSERFLILFGAGSVATGLARYTLRRAARRLAASEERRGRERRSA